MKISRITVVLLYCQVTLIGSATLISPPSLTSETIHLSDLHTQTRFNKWKYHTNSTRPQHNLSYLIKMHFPKINKSKTVFDRDSDASNIRAETIFLGEGIDGIPAFYLTNVKVAYPCMQEHTMQNSELYSPKFSSQRNRYSSHTCTSYMYNTLGPAFAS